MRNEDNLLISSLYSNYLRKWKKFLHHIGPNKTNLLAINNKCPAVTGMEPWNEWTPVCEQHANSLQHTFIPLTINCVLYQYQNYISNIGTYPSLKWSETKPFRICKEKEKKRIISPVSTVSKSVFISLFVYKLQIISKHNYIIELLIACY